MKHNIITLLSGACLLSALAFAGCTKAILEPSGFPEDGVVRISTGSPLTKAEGSSSAYEGTTLGLYVNYGIGKSYTKTNIQWTKNESGEWTPKDQMLWKNPTEGPTLWAYAPYNASQLLPNQDTDFGKLEFTIPADQSAGITQADFVTWGQQNYIPDHNKNANFSEDGKVQVNFSHKLVKLTFNFTIRTQFAPGTTISKATLLGTTSKVSCDIFGSGVANANGAVSRDIVLHKVSDLVFEGIFFPGDGQKAGSKMLEVEMSDGKVLTYTVGNADLNFESGKAYTMNMYLGKHEVEMASVTLEPWVDSEKVIDGGDGSETAVPAWSGSVASNFASGSGTQADPYIIKTGEQLAYLAQQVNAGTNYSGKFFKLSNSINLAGKPWTPIGYRTEDFYEYGFKGKFDGNGNSIYGLKVNSESSYAGLFGCAGKGSEISNLSVIKADIATTRSYAGAICGYLNSGTISNCSVVGGSVSAGSNRSGGICGQSYGSAKIEKCSVSSTSISASSIAGGICGEISGSLESCKGTDLEITAGGWVGGITAACQNGTTTTIKNCSIYSSKIVFQKLQVDSRAGGLVAHCQSLDLKISDCSSQVDFFIANTDYQSYIGGLFGYIYQPGTFTNCHFDGCFMNESGEVIDYNTASSKYTNYSSSLTLGAAIGKHNQGSCIFINCSYNAGKTGNIPMVKTSIASQDYSGIIAK